jgi:4-hydroxybenzoate polyprenyltransferase
MNAAVEANPRIVDSAESLGVLVVDLDGTLIKTDLLLESLLSLLKAHPQYLFLLPIWLWKGKAYLKQQVARRVSLDVRVLPYRNDLLGYLRAQRAAGCRIILATGSDMLFAGQIADHLKLFDMVLASDGARNLSGADKRNLLVEEFGDKGFDYVGNDRHDLVVWASARKAIIVNPSPLVNSSVAQVAHVERILTDQRKGLGDYLRALRLSHWLKNLLVFVPLLAAHRFYENALLGKALLAFLAFGCFASAGYLVNDLLDLQADRYHPRKRFRAFSSGDLPLSYGLGIVPALILLGCIFGALVSLEFVEIVLLYFGLSLAYSLRLKEIPILDVVILAGLYSLRIMGGAVADGIWPSHWLLAFSTFWFFGLALVKRYSELIIMKNANGDGAKARGYESSDGELLSSMGIASGYLSVLVLALYISSDTARVLYHRYEYMWFLCPLLLVWISYVWLIAHRGRMPDDPLVFATSDRISLILVLLMLVVAVLAI